MLGLQCFGENMRHEMGARLLNGFHGENCMGRNRETIGAVGAPVIQGF